MRRKKLHRYPSEFWGLPTLVKHAPGQRLSLTFSSLEEARNWRNSFYNFRSALRDEVTAHPELPNLAIVSRRAERLILSLKEDTVHVRLPRY